MVVRHPMRKLLIIILLSCCYPLWSNVSVRASVNSHRIGKDEVLRYTIKVESEENIKIDEPVLPPLANLAFRNIYTSSSSMTSIVNFRSTRKITREFTYVLIPTGLGVATIPSVNVKAANKIFRTDPISIEITEGHGSPPASSSPDPYSYDPFESFGMGDWGFDDRPVGETMLIAVPEKTVAYLGEPIVISYYVYTEQAVTSLNLTEEKDFDGYGKEIFEQPSMLSFDNASLKGRSFKRSLIKRIAISPNRSGRIRAPYMEAVVKTYDIIYRSRKISTQDLHIEVRELPENGKPANFSGAVGSFKVSDNISQTDIALGEAVNYSIVISGRGNFNQFIAPGFAAKPLLQISSPQSSDRLNAGIDGNRTIYYTIIPQEKGEYTLQMPEFNWFDPASGSYRSYKGESRKLSVAPANVFSYFTNFFAKDRVMRLNPMQEIDSYKSYRLYVHGLWFWLCVALLGAAMAMSFYLARQKSLRFRDPLRYADYQAGKILRRYLKDASKAAAESSKDFYPLAEKGLMHYLAEKYHISKRLSIPEKLSELQARQIPEDQIYMLNSFLQRCQMVRFAPGGFEESAIKADKESLDQIIISFVNLKSRRKA